MTRPEPFAAHSPRSADLDDPSALDLVVSLMVFAPSLTPSVCRYLISLSGDSRDDVENTVRNLVARSLSDWQVVWVCHVARELRLDHAKITEWATRQVAEGRGRLVSAQGALFLATLGHRSLLDLDSALRTEPEPLAPWYVMAAKELAAQPTFVSSAQLKAISDSDPLYAILLKE